MGLKRAYIIILPRPYRRIVRVARKKVVTESDREDETPCAKPLDVRGKYLPMNFKPQTNLDFLQNNVARNLQVDSKHYIHTLRQIQQYMIPLVLNEFPFVVAGPAGAGKTTGYLLPLVNKLVELKEIELSLERVKFIVVEEFHYCTKNSEYKKELTVLKDLLKKHEVQPTCFFISMLTSREKMFDIGFMTSLARTKVTRLAAPSLVDDVSVGVLPCSSIKDHCGWLIRLIAGEGVVARKTVVLVNHPQRAHYVALLLTYLGVSATFLTKDDTLLAAEDAVRQWRTEECRVLAADYDSLPDLDYGFVETCVLFELPDSDFCSFHKRILSLSAKLSYKRRVFILINKELDSTAASCVVGFLEHLKQPIPQFLVDLADSAGEPDQESGSSASSEDDGVQQGAVPY
ncbi:unnamed protein product [Heligmosomoides polygyrus]|uniref:Helicase ATP-binding domain-containing protein n=1 Tax=Heligmosomoides polygyrus TaxID=6339 RepID=A0A3P7ZLP2_HELPZ|nr:unnamed protein product [Heligmosomoides polygyrus]